MAPVTADMEYVDVVPAQIGVLPEMPPVIVGKGVTVTAIVCGDEAPHALFAVTVIFPDAVPAVVVMLFVVDVPDQPPGNDHI